MEASPCFTGVLNLLSTILPGCCIFKCCFNPEEEDVGLCDCRLCCPIQWSVIKGSPCFEQPTDGTSSPEQGLKVLHVVLSSRKSIAAAKQLAKLYLATYHNLEVVKLQIGTLLISCQRAAFLHDGRV